MTRNSIFGNFFGLALGVLAFSFSLNASAEKLDLSEGTMTSAGIAAVRYHSNDIGTYAATNWSAGIGFNFGYFVIDNFALLFDVGAMGQFTTAADATRKFTFGVDLMYAFDTNSVVRPYILVGGFGAWGSGIGVEPAKFATGTTVTQGWSAGVKPALGLLIGLNQYVALDFGIRGTIDFAINRAPAGTAIDAGVGYFGVRGFF